MRRPLACLALAIGLAAALGPAHAQAPVPAAPAAPVAVKLGLYVNALSNLDFLAGTFDADFWIWCVSSEGHLAPLATLDFANETDKTLEPVSSSRTPAGLWEQRRVRVTLRADWNTDPFPFDRQKLEIFVEDNAASKDELVYTVDKANSGLGTAVRLPGWHIAGWTMNAGDHLYRSNFGDPRATAATVTYSRVTFAVDIRRDGWLLLFDLSLGALVAFGILALTFCMNPNLPPIFAGRMGVIVASAFTVIISLRNADGTIAHPTGTTLIDRIHLLTLGAAFVAAIGAVVARHVSEGGREAAAMALDRRAMPAFIAVYVLTVVAMIVVSLTS